MDVTAGRAEVVIGLIDGPVAVEHPDLAGSGIRTLPGMSAACASAGPACAHGTFVAGILVAQRGSVAPAICPGCTLLVRPIFLETSAVSGMPTAAPEELAAAIVECIDDGARLINVSAALQGFGRGEWELTGALDLASRRGVVVVAAAGNQRQVGSSAVTRHRWVIPVVACAADGRPIEDSNLGGSIGRQGLGAPGREVMSLAPGGRSVSSEGTSVAAPFVTGAAALLWSRFPQAAGATVRFAMTSAVGRPRRGIVPPLLDAWSAYQAMARA
jgi:subtilisin family serine protease